MYLDLIDIDMKLCDRISKFKIADQWIPGDVGGGGCRNPPKVCPD